MITVVICFGSRILAYCFAKSWNKDWSSKLLEIFSYFLHRSISFLSQTLDGSEYPSIFENLVSLYTDLNLRHEKDAVILSLVLKSCHSLENLEIKIDEVRFLLLNTYHMLISYCFVYLYTVI